MGKRKDKNYNKKSTSFILSLLTLISIVACGFLVYNIYLLSDIENTIRYSVIGVLILIVLIFIIKTTVINKKINNGKNKKSRKGFIIFIFLFSLLCGIGGSLISYIYGTVDSINKKYVTYESYLVVMNKNKANNINDIKNMDIAILNDNKSPDGYIIPMDIVDENKLQDENKLVNYDDYLSMIVDLYAGDIDAIFVPHNYVDQFKDIDKYKNIETDTKVIIKKSKKLEKASTSKIETSSSGKSVTEPFTIVLMGIDSTDEVLEKNAIANGDTLIVITFNPKTLNATMLSIPRDSYVPIACWPGKDRNKITHAAGYGTQCMIDTIENYLETDIDYYAKVNFKGLVKLVDSLGGIEVDVDQDLCTDSSNRKGKVCIKKGKQTLDGEHALVYARNRKQLANGDFGRNAHQQEIILALVNKIKSINNVSDFMDILNTVSNSMDTNLSTKQILSFYNIAKDIMNVSSNEYAQIVNIDRLYLAGHGQMIYDSRMKMTLYNYVPNTHSRADIIDAMHKNLGKSKHASITKFSFSINNPYKEKIIGEGPYTDGYETVTSAAPPTTTKKSTTNNTVKKQEQTTTNNNTNNVKPVEPAEPVTPSNPVNPGEDEGGTDSGSTNENP